MPSKLVTPDSLIEPRPLSLAEDFPTLVGGEVSKNAHIADQVPEAVTTANLKTLRVTSLVTLSACPAQFRSRYLLSEEEVRKAIIVPQVQNKHAQFGTWVHEIVESFMRGRWELNSKRHRDIEELLKTRNMPLKEINCLAEYLFTLAPFRDKVVALEYECEMPLPGIGKKLVGHIDLVLQANADTLVIIDHKTNREEKPLSYWQRNPQPLFYSMLARRLWPQFSRVMFRIGYVNLKKSLHWETDPANDAQIIQWLQEAWSGVQSSEQTGVWQRTYSDDGCKYCPEQSQCSEFKACGKRLMQSLADVHPGVSVED